MDKLQVQMITKIADLEAEIIELENLLSQHPVSEKRTLWKKDLTKLKTQMTKTRNALEKDLERTELHA